MVGSSPSVRFGVRTDPGRVRSNNEDAYLASPPRFAVADGLGGQASGELASSLVIRRLAGAGPAMLGRAGLQSLLEGANSELREAAQRDLELHGMATTCTVIELAGSEVHLAHVGDSRAYRYSTGTLERMTTDHTYAAELLKKGDMSAAEVEQMVDSAVLTRALGSTDQVEVDTHSFGLGAGDRVLLCSDGLTQEVPESLIGEILGSAPAAQAAADGLVEAALRAGGRDNVTCVVIESAAHDRLADGGATDMPPGDPRTDGAPTTTVPSAHRSLLILLLAIGVALLLAAGYASGLLGPWP